MGRKQRLLQAFLCTIAFVLGGSSVGVSIHSSADTVAIVRPDPVNVGIAPGESAKVAIWIEGVADLYGAQIELRFNPAIVEVQDADTDTEGIQVRPGEFLDPAQGFVAANKVDNETGEILYGITLLSPASPANGSGALISIDVIALAVGRSEWVFQEVILATQDGVSTPVEVETGWVAVEDGQSTPSLPTSTPAPTDTPTTPTPSSSAVVPVASPTPTREVGSTSLPNVEPSDAVLTSTDASLEPLTSESANTPAAVETPSAEQATLPVAEAEVTAIPSPTHWPTVAVPTRAAGTRATPEAEKSGVQAALPAILVAAGAVVVFATGLYLYRGRRHREDV